MAKGVAHLSTCLVCTKTLVWSLAPYNRDMVSNAYNQRTEVGRKGIQSQPKICENMSQNKNKMDPWVKCLLHKHKDLSSDSPEPI